MGTTDYPASTLARLKSKGNRWYVYVTVPDGLRDALGGKRQLRASTGTTDEREAKRRQHVLTESLYAKLDAAKPNPLRAAYEELVQALSLQPSGANAYQDEDEIEVVLALARSRMYAVPTGQDFEDDFAIEAEKKRVAVPLAELEEVLQGKSQQVRTVSEVAEEAISAGRITATNLTYVRLASKEFEDLLPNVGLEDVTQTHLYQFAESLHERGLAKNTISGRLTKLSLVFNFSIQRGYRQTNPRIGMNLSGLGREQRSYRPFSKEELHQIFGLELPHRERLLMTILLATGMRRDEAALLTWERVKDEDGVHFLDLTDGLVKTLGSKRRVPIIEPVLKLLGPRGDGRLFDYTLNKSGKTVDASQACLRFIRMVTADEQKSLHSFRGTLKDLLRDAGVSQEVNDFITGHSSGDVAGKYGQGPSLKVRYEALSSVHHPWFSGT